MRIVHFSDFHAEFDWRLPAADVYVCSGDMLPNFPLVELVHERNGNRVVKPFNEAKGMSEHWLYAGRELHPATEAEAQKEWLARHWQHDIFRQTMFGNPDAPVVCVRGNHDFINLSELFGGEVYEIHEPTDAFMVKGLKFGGMRGINYIIGEWSDELQEEDLLEKARQLPMDLDVLVTHAPPAGILDLNYGVTGFRSYHDRMAYEEHLLKAHLFGHVHLYGGTVEERQWGDKICKMSNASRAYTIVEV